MSVHDLVLHHGRWFWSVVFVWAFLQGETFVIFAGAAAAQDVLDIRLLILFAWIGTFCGDQFYFYLGRKFGPGLMHRFPSLERATKKILTRIEKHDRVFILFYRFIYGVRNVSPFALGLSHITYKEFTRLNVFAALLAAFGFSMIGYLFGEALDNVLGSIQDVMLGVGVIVVLIFAIKYAVKKWHKKH